MFSSNTWWSFVCCWLSRVGYSKADEQFCMFGQGPLSMVSVVKWSVWAVWGTPMSASSHLGSLWGLSCQRTSNLLPGCQPCRRPVGRGGLSIQSTAFKLQLILPVLRIMLLPQLCLVSPCPEMLMFNSLQRINLSTSAWVERGVLTVTLPASALLEVLVLQSYEVVFMDNGGTASCSSLPAPESACSGLLRQLFVHLLFFFFKLVYWGIIDIYWTACSSHFSAPLKVFPERVVCTHCLESLSLTLKSAFHQVRFLLTLPKLLIRITEDHHIPELSGQFSVLILLNLSAASVQLDLCVHSWSHRQEADMAEHTHAWSHRHIKIMNVFLIPRSSAASL